MTFHHKIRGMRTTSTVKFINTYLYSNMIPENNQHTKKMFNKFAKFLKSTK